MPSTAKKQQTEISKQTRGTRRQTLPQIRKAETRVRLLNAARNIFSSHGYEGASVAQIADEAGISKGALYVHFKSKEALFRELLIDHVKRRSAATTATLGPNVPLREGVIRLVEGAWGVCDDGDSCASLSAEFFALAGRNDWGSEAMDTVFDHCSAVLVHFLDEAKARGEVRADLNSFAAARMILALHDGSVMQRQNRLKADDLKEFLESMVEMILSYIETREDLS